MTFFRKGNFMATKKYQLPIYYENKALEYGKKYGLKTNPVQEGWDDEVDAFRHAFMQAYITANQDEKTAKFLGDTYEKIGDFTHTQPSSERNMDMWNNAIGREIGDEVKNETSLFRDLTTQKMFEDMIAEKIYTKIKNGEMITSPKDLRDFETSPYNGRIYTREEIGSMSPEEYEINKKLIDKALSKGDVMPEADAKNAVQSGNAIYVKSYKRSDGTSVKGYYRRK